ncbi:hypothetical protein MP228_006127 [Amoeboaphelidium protococcarum]|nr:hypothetical protein MP228_006127 [Amoeboaphelidium protococcarum]
MNSEALKEFNKRELLDIIDSVGGVKALVLDPSLSGPLSLMVGYSVLKEHGIEKIYLLDGPELQTDCASILYLTRGSVHLMKLISQQVKGLIRQATPPRATSHPDGIDQSSGSNNFASNALDSEQFDRNFKVIFIPKRLSACERVLEDSGVLADVSISELHLDWIPLADDVWSLEIPQLFPDLYIDGDTTCLYDVAKSLMKIQHMYGLIPRILGLGSNAQIVADLVKQMREEHGLDEHYSSQSLSSQSLPHLDCLYVFDRTADMYTPLLTGLTYESLVNDFIGINNVSVEIDHRVAKSIQPGDKQKHSLSRQNDALYDDLKCLNFVSVPAVLNSVAKEISSDYQQRDQAKTVSQLKEFVNKLGGLKVKQSSLSVHVAMCEYIQRLTGDRKFRLMLEYEQNALMGQLDQFLDQYLEALIYSGETSVYEVMRLLCLQSITSPSGGLKSKSIELLRTAVLQQYGYQYVSLFDILESRLNLLAQSGGGKAKSNVQLLKDRLKLVMENVNEQEPDDMSYVYSGYFSPVLCRLVEVMQKNRFQNQQVGPDQAAIMQKQQQSLPKEKQSPNEKQSQSYVSQIMNSRRKQNQRAGTDVWNGLTEVVDSIGLTKVEEYQQPPKGSVSSQLNASNVTSYGNAAAGNRSRIVLVLFLGGCTYSELAAIRYLNSRSQTEEYVVLTTSMLNGVKLMETIGHASGCNWQSLLSSSQLMN